ncbi:hypothetical protein [Hymenobacter sp. BT190]|uniref:hypothetical protein n=1 Tax=Hymenobacter sp. BT190 TaxID=2763505 RepID=UPI001651122E|nr:hypothetical protein [Hymenobacter sp. BT190]MBC6698091.1 hypothetical protein [Hymenobacter sp. BT190]
MKISFDRLAFWILPYLYLVSVAYNTGYWGTFGIDAFNYYPIQDLVKGVTAPLVSTVVVTLINSIFHMLCKAVLERLGNISGWFVLVVVIISCGAYYYLNLRPVTSDTERLVIEARTNWDVYFIGFMFLNFIVSSLIGKLIIPENAGYWRKEGTLGVLFFVNFLVVNAFIEGRKDAWQIENNYVYDYVIPSSQNSSINLTKYLGKAGNHHFFLSNNNSVRTIIAEEKIEKLELGYYILGDSVQEARLNQYKAAMHSDSVNQLLQKLPQTPPSLPIQRPSAG